MTEVRRTTERPLRRRSPWTRGLPLALGLILSGPVSLHAIQTGSIVGVTSEAGTGRALATVSVAATGSPGGAGLRAVSDAEGSFRIDGVPAGPVTVSVTRLGYLPQTLEVVVGAGQTVTADFGLVPSAVALDALVATATGIQRRREVGNAITSVHVAREVERVAPVTVTALLQGRAPGVQVMQSSGSVGSSSLIRVRGNTSINLGNTPLVYVDGVRVSNNVQAGPGVGGQNASRLDDLNPNDIESIEIVKGPSAATLYGTEASAGVIRITTKRGAEGRAEWTFSTEMGRNWDATDWPDNVFNPRSFLPTADFGPSVPDTLYRLNLLEGVGTNQNPWRTGGERSYSASLRGGTSEMGYFLSAGWSNREGSLPNNEATRRTLRANFTLTPSENVDVLLSTSFASSRLTMPDSDNNVFGYTGVALAGSPWDLPIRRDDPGSPATDVLTCPLDYEFSRATGAPLGSVGCEDTPFFSNRTFGDIATIENDERVERFTGSATVEYRPRSFITARGIAGYDEFADQTGSFVPVDPDLPFGDFSRGYRSISNGVVRIFSLQADASATFDLTPEIRSVTSVGMQFSRVKSEATASVGRFLPAGSKLVSSAVITEGSEASGETRNAGFYLEQQLAWRDRLFVTPALRVDDNAAFGEGLGRKAYPRVMASYVVSEEAWFREMVPARWVENLRVRGAWGTSGKHPAAFSSIAAFGSQRVTFRGEDEAGVILVGPGNPDLKPETGREIELGFEADVLDGRLGVDFTWFSKTAYDAIVARTLAPSTGYPASVASNIGEMLNRGVEVGLYGVAVSRPVVRWDWQLSLATVHNRITELDEPIIYGANGDSQRHQEGLPYAAYFSRTYSVDDDGDVVVSDDPEYQGQPTPEYEGSISTSVTLLGFVSLYANVGFAGGHQLFNSTEEFRCGYLGGGVYGGVCEQIFERDGSGGRTDMARIKAQAAEDVQYDPWIEDATYFRLRTLAARVEIPPTLIERFGARRANFTLQAENLFLSTAYSGPDPEVSSDGASQSLRLDFFTLPPARRITGRFQVTF